MNDDRTLGFSVYRKPTHTDQYLQFDSHQPLEHKLGVLCTLTHRAKTICSTNDDLDKEITHVKKVLSVSGYTRWAWKLPTSKKTSTSTPTNATKSKGHVTVPYVRGVTELIARKMRQNGVTVHSKPINTIRGMLVAPKDKVKKKDKSGTIYQIKCAKCEATYIGETERPLRKRIKEHHRDASPVGAHMTAHKHTFSEENVCILHRESRWFPRGVQEASFIAAREPALNRDNGRYQLPTVYSSLLKSHDRGLSSESCDC